MNLDYLSVVILNAEVKEESEGMAALPYQEKKKATRKVMEGLLAKVSI